MQEFNPKAISFSDKAINHFRISLNHRGYGDGVRIGVKEAGCSGYEYVLVFVDDIDQNVLELREGSVVGDVDGLVIGSLLGEDDESTDGEIDDGL